MEQLEIKIIATLVALSVYIILRTVASRFIDKTVATGSLHKTRGKIVKKAVNLVLLLLAFTIISIVWGVEKGELAIFIGSVLTVIGIALFAQWSILSNITAGIILFFNHSVKLDDTIAIIDKDFNIEGRVSDIGIFFVILKTESGEKVSVPNNVFIQKMIRHKS
ncbi:MAG TPA: mechanosensitive ion channel domain-containing protein [Cryomorphaceae bacterium]|nr:mechanosensitive ion channel domain-containing protein [Cryomorphaceae bacterium]